MQPQMVSLNYSNVRCLWMMGIITQSTLIKFLGNFDLIQELVKSDLDVNRQNDVGDTALIRATEVCKCLFEHFQLFHKRTNWIFLLIQNILLNLSPLFSQLWNDWIPNK